MPRFTRKTWLTIINIICTVANVAALIGLRGKKYLDDWEVDMCSVVASISAIALSILHLTAIHEKKEEKDQLGRGTPTPREGAPDKHSKRGCDVRKTLLTIVNIICTVANVAALIGLRGKKYLEDWELDLCSVVASISAIALAILHLTAILEKKEEKDLQLGRGAPTPREGAQTTTARSPMQAQAPLPVFPREDILRPF